MIDELERKFLIYATITLVIFIFFSAIIAAYMQIVYVITKHVLTFVTNNNRLHTTCYLYINQEKIKTRLSMQIVIHFFCSATLLLLIYSSHETYPLHTFR